MSEEVKQAIVNLLRTIAANAAASSVALEGIAKQLESKEDLPETSRSSHYS